MKVGWGAACALLAACLAADGVYGQEPVPVPVPAPAPTAAPTPRFVIERFRLFPSLAATRLDLTLPTPPPRAFHQQGDPDSLFTFGGPTPDGEVRLKAAIEVNDVILRAITPDMRVDPSDTRFRSGGDYRALDARGRPYQFRLGARLVW
jgi:hypothetical protein